MATVVYLKKGERRPDGDTSPLLDCRPSRREQAIKQSSAGLTIYIRLDDLEKAIADLSDKGAETIYVRKH